jgi:hypothetical protein
MDMDEFGDYQVEVKPQKKKENNLMELEIEESSENSDSKGKGGKSGLDIMDL